MREADGPGPGVRRWSPATGRAERAHGPLEDRASFAPIAFTVDWQLVGSDAGIQAPALWVRRRVRRRVEPGTRTAAKRVDSGA